jgi:hypothetical protein
LQLVECLERKGSGSLGFENPDRISAELLPELHRFYLPRTRFVVIVASQSRGDQLEGFFGAHLLRGGSATRNEQQQQRNRTDASSHDCPWRTRASAASTRVLMAARSRSIS